MTDPVDPLRRLWEDLQRDGRPAFEWVVEFVSEDGDLEEVWLYSNDPEALAGIAERVDPKRATAAVWHAMEDVWSNSETDDDYVKEEIERAGYYLRTGDPGDVAKAAYAVQRACALDLLRTDDTERGQLARVSLFAEKMVEAAEIVADLLRAKLYAPTLEELSK
jgi:hypothetical protein